MLSIIFLCFLVFPKFCVCLNCYSCSGGTGCNDPFNSLGSGVTTTGTSSTNTYCVKTNYIGTITRTGASSCTTYWYSSNAYQACCQTDFCNQTTKLNFNQSFIIFSLIIFYFFYRI